MTVEEYEFVTLSFSKFQWKSMLVQHYETSFFICQTSLYLHIKFDLFKVSVHTFRVIRYVCVFRNKAHLMVNRKCILQDLAICQFWRYKLENYNSKWDETRMKLDEKFYILNDLRSTERCSSSIYPFIH